MFDINAIKNHILYLKTKCNLFVSLHALDYNSLVNLDHLNMFAIHDNPYCAYIKSSYNAYCHCLLNQHRVIIKGQNGSFQGICYAGVQEYVYPIHKGKYTVGMVCVSGYQCENAMQYLNHVSIKYDLIQL